MESLIAEWYDFATLSMLDDGEITWWAKKPEPLAVLAFDSFEDKCEVNVRRVVKRRNADIKIVRRKNFIDGYASGRASWGKDTKYKWKIEVVNEIEGYDTETAVIHEIGHALGLNHPEVHHLNPKTMLSYRRNPHRVKWYKQDILNFNEVFNPDWSDEITNPYATSSVIDSDSIGRIKLHGPSQTSVDYITGLHKHPH